MPGYNTQPDLIADLQRMQQRLTNIETNTQQFRNPLVKVTRTTNFSCPNNAFTAFPFEATEFDTASMWSAGTPTVLTVPYAGVFAFFASCEWAFSGTGIRGLAIGQGANIRGEVRVNATATSIPKLSTSAVLKCAKADQITMQVLQDSGGLLTMDGGGGALQSLSGAWLGVG